MHRRIAHTWLTVALMQDTSVWARELAVAEVDGQGCNATLALSVQFHFPKMVRV